MAWSGFTECKNVSLCCVLSGGAKVGSRAPNHCGHKETVEVQKWVPGHKEAAEVPQSAAGDKEIVKA